MSNSAFSLRLNDVQAKVLTGFFAASGIFCSLYAARSCQWQLFSPSENDSSDWAYLPPDASDVYSIGLFGYQLKVDGVNQWDVPCTAYPSPFVRETWWFRGPQLIGLLSPVMTAVGVSLFLAGVNMRVVAPIIAHSSAWQTIGFIVSLAWCNEGPFQCPLLVGSVSSLGAAFFYLMAFVAAVAKEAPLTKKLIGTDEVIGVESVGLDALETELTTPLLV